MKRKLFLFALVAEALLCVLLAVFKAPINDVFLALMAFPFEQIGVGLRALSLSCIAGNVFAFLIYALFCLLPAGALLFIRHKRPLSPEDGLLPVLSITLFAVVYQMINPGLIAGMFQSIPVGKAVLGGTIYSIVIAFLILRTVRELRASGMERLQRWLFVLLGLLNVVFVCLIFGVSVGELKSSITALQQGNAGNENLLGASYVFAFLQYFVNVLPYGFDILIVFAGMKLLGSMADDRHSEAAVSAASRLSKLCGTALSVTVLAIASFNLLQVIFAKRLFNLHASLQIPLFSFAFVLAALLVSRLIAENKLLKEDNDSII